jgi:hypothetical protein
MDGCQFPERRWPAGPAARAAATKKDGGRGHSGHKNTLAASKAMLADAEMGRGYCESEKMRQARGMGLVQRQKKCRVADSWRRMGRVLIAEPLAGQAACRLVSGAPR